MKITIGNLLSLALGLCTGQVFFAAIEDIAWSTAGERSFFMCATLFSVWLVARFISGGGDRT